MATFLRRIAFALSFLCASAETDGLNAQLRIVSYNTTPTIQPELQTVLQAIGEESVLGIARPIDILAVQEQSRLAVETETIRQMLDSLYGPGAYARSTRTGQGFTTQAVIYNTQTVSLVEETAIGTASSQGGPRQTMRYRFRPVGYDGSAEFYLYNSHLKANNTDEDAERRAIEVVGIRADAASRGPELPIIYLGDLNLYRDTEPAYQAFTAEGPQRAIDPIDREGFWNRNSRFRDIHTQSTTVRGGDGRAGGGVNDRFDFQLVTSSLLDGEGLSYLGPRVPNLSDVPDRESYRVFGNNGSHFTARNISTGTGAEPSVLAALELASDHLPVVVDYQLPARMNVEFSETPTRVLQDAAVNATVRIAHGVAAVAPLGVDELDYAVFLGSSAALAQGTLLAGSTADTVTIPLPTDTAGPQVHDLRIEAKSTQVPEPVRRRLTAYQVLERGEASFDPAVLISSTTIDLGIVVVDAGEEVSRFAVNVHHLEPNPGLTAGVVLGPVQRSDGAGALFLDDTMLSRSGESTLRGTLSLDEIGRQSARWVIPVEDEPLPGAASRTPLELTVSATVVRRSQADLDGDGQLSIGDLEQLQEAIVSERPLPAGDLDGDGQVDVQDKVIWVEHVFGTFAGDANLDGQFDSTDLVDVFRAGEYEDEAPRNSRWSTGDWNTDGDFTSGDLVIALQQGGYGAAAAHQVPEPAGLLRWTAIALLFRRQPRKRYYGVPLR